MKKNRLVLAFIVCLMVILVSVVTFSTTYSNYSILSNVEALAKDEMDSGMIYCSLAYTRDNKCSCYCCGGYQTGCVCGTVLKNNRNSQFGQCYKN